MSETETFRGSSQDIEMTSCARTVFMHEFSDTKNECLNTVQSTFHAVICVFYTYDIFTLNQLFTLTPQNKRQVLFSLRLSENTLSLLRKPSVNIFRREC